MAVLITTSSSIVLNNRAANSVINVGSGLVAGSQSNSNANTKVGS